MCGNSTQFIVVTFALYSDYFRRHVGYRYIVYPFLLVLAASVVTLRVCYLCGAIMQESRLLTEANDVK